MKRRFGGTVIAMVLCFILTVVSVYADDGKGQIRICNRLLYDRTEYTGRGRYFMMKQTLRVLN